MTLSIAFPKSKPRDADTVVLFVFAKNAMTPAAQEFDRRSDGFIGDILKRDKKFTGKLGQAKIIALPSIAPYMQVLLFGLGDARDYTQAKAEEAGGKLLAALESAHAVSAVIHGDAIKDLKIKAPEFFAHLALGLKLRGYKFRKYKSANKDDPKALHEIAILGAGADKTYRNLDAIAEGVYLARDLVNEPPNVLYPESFARRIEAELKPLGVEVEIIDEKKMEKLGMNAALAVGQGSIRPPRMVVMRWNVGKKNKPVAFVGKGITFDTGGISIKPAQGMEEMKMDMGGAAAVVGLMKSLALSKSKASVVAMVATAENMPSDRAYRPSDIVKSYAGKTIEVLNTDAEGRLVLCDAMSYIQKIYKPKMLIDLATLTGAIMVALGGEYAGVFANDDKLWARLEKAGKEAGEKIWRMPLDDAFKKEMKGSITDLKNIGNGRNAGACTAAGFLEHFVEKDTPWAHFDIAGMAWSYAPHPVTTPKSGTGFGVRLLRRFVQDNYE